MTGRERILTTLTGGIPDKVGNSESPWAETIVRWRQEGLAEDADVADALHMDILNMGGIDMSLRLPVEVFEETDEYRLLRDANGVTRKDFKRESGHTPHWIDHVVRTRADWMKYRDRLEPTPERLADSARTAYDHGRERGRFVCFNTPEAYELAWPVFGQVGIFTLMMDAPELIADVFEVYTDLIIGMARIALDAGLDFDGCFFYGDLGYRNATLFSPRLYESLLMPQHARMCGFFNDLNKPVILHSCGRIQELIPRFIEAGFAAIQPLEAKAGQDVRELKPLYGDRITFFGNMDIRKLSGSKQDVEGEVVPKLLAAKEGGRYIFHSDHSVPPTVSFDNYLYALELLEKHGSYQ